jgi:hypothetical protein
MSTVPATPAPFSLRLLPLPAKLVITCFLLAVGGGYTAAMVQLHFQDSKSGEMMPTMHDVVLKFTGKKWYESDPPRPMNKFEKLITAPESLTFGGNGTMAPAFFDKDGGTYARIAKTSESELKRVRAEREGERSALALWASAPADVREKSYHDDRFTIDPAKKPPAITPEFASGPDGVKVKSIIEARCARCHKAGEAQSGFPLETYEQIAKYLASPATVTVKAGGDWVKVEEPIGLEKLTQSTHAHLLSFAMLFALTGLVFAFTTYPTSLRCILGPWVLLAVVADVALWWLARLSNDWGPYFAMAIIGSGGAAGLGLAAQIVLSLWNMYGVTGRIALLLVFATLGGCGALVYQEQIKPGLEKKLQSLNARAEADKKADEPKPNASVPDPKPAAIDKGTNAQTQPTPAVKASPMERVLHYPVVGADGKELPLLKIPFKGEQEGGMVRAFFDKDATDFAQAVKEKDQEAQNKLKPERFDEIEAVRAWLRLPDIDRRKAFDSDAMDLPASLAGKPFTKEYLNANKVKVKTLLADRCVRCHQPGSDGEKYPFETYDQILPELQPGK